MSEGERGVGGGDRVNDLGDLHEVHADEALDGEDGGEVVGGVLQEEEADLGVRGEVGLEVGDDECGEEVGVRKRILARLLGEWLGCECLHGIGDEISVGHRRVSTVV